VGVAVGGEVGGLGAFGAPLSTSSSLAFWAVFVCRCALSHSLSLPVSFSLFLLCSAQVASLKGMEVGAGAKKRGMEQRSIVKSFRYLQRQCKNC